MIELLVHYYDNHNVTTPDPSELEIITALKSLDGVDKLLVMLSFREGNLFVHASESKRMHVSYCRNSRFARLIDKNAPDSEMLRFAHGNGEIDEWPLRATVSSEAAIGVALFFLRNNAFPKGFDWEGETQYLPLGD